MGASTGANRKGQSAMKPPPASQNIKLSRQFLIGTQCLTCVANRTLTISPGTKAPTLQGAFGLNSKRLLPDTLPLIQHTVFPRPQALMV